MLIEELTLPVLDEVAEDVLHGVCALHRIVLMMTKLLIAEVTCFLSHDASHFLFSHCLDMILAEAEALIENLVLYCV